MDKISTFLSAVAVVGMLTACSGETGQSTTVLSSLSVSTTGQTPFAAPEAAQLLKGDLLSSEQTRVHEDERAAAVILHEQFHGTSIDGLAPVKVVVAARFACTMMDPADRNLYQPAALEMSMRDTYAWYREEQEMRIFSAMLIHFCPEFYPGDQVIDQLIADVTSG